MLILNLAAGEQFTGAVRGMDTNSGVSINLKNFPFDLFSSSTFDVSTEVLTVTDAITGSIININIVASGVFLLEVAADGKSTSIIKA